MKPTTRTTLLPYTMPATYQRQEFMFFYIFCHYLLFALSINHETNNSDYIAAVHNACSLSEAGISWVGALNCHLPRARTPCPAQMLGEDASLMTGVSPPPLRMPAVHGITTHIAMTVACVTMHIVEMDITTGGAPAELMGATVLGVPMAETEGVGVLLPRQ